MGWEFVECDGESDVFAARDSGGDSEESGPDHKVSREGFWPGELPVEPVSVDDTDPDIDDESEHERRDDGFHAEVESVADFCG